MALWPYPGGESISPPYSSIKTSPCSEPVLRKRNWFEVLNAQERGVGVGDVSQVREAVGACDSKLQEKHEKHPGRLGLDRAISYRYIPPKTEDLKHAEDHCGLCGSPQTCTPGLYLRRVSVQGGRFSVIKYEFKILLIIIERD